MASTSRPILAVIRAISGWDVALGASSWIMRSGSLNDGSSDSLSSGSTARPANAVTTAAAKIAPDRRTVHASILS